MGFSSALYDKEYLDLLESRLDTNAKTPIIILGITPHSLLYYGYPNGHIKRFQKMKKEEVIDYLYLFSLKTFFSPLRFDTKWQLASSKENNYMQDFNYTQGWAASDYKNRDINHALKPYAQIFMNKQISEKNLKFLMQTIERWSKSGIAVYGFVPPSSAKIEQIERENTTFNDQEIVKDFIQAGGKWISLNGVFQSYDGSHLKRPIYKLAI
ncbi:MAG: hypothetical protein B7C24_17075 [Bacteroidetes bacterium 4572_77]|nr:MAG: hypothetical protein B7C24_17075 [Bacteroidetes bacterium 4572_77]